MATQVILLEKVHNLGDIGDLVSVKPGYARNYLIPKGIALVANKQNQAEIERRRAELESAEAEHKAEAERRAETIRDAVITVQARVAEEGRLYGSVANTSIADAAQAMGVELEKSEIDMPDGAIHETGTYSVVARLHAEVEATFTVVVEELVEDQG